MKKDLLTIRDLDSDDYQRILMRALDIKADIPAYYGIFEGQTIVLIFDKPSLRTRVTFQVAMHQFGGSAIYMPGEDIGLGVRESVPDGARNLSRWVQGIVVRTFEQRFVEELAEHATIPIINALTDHEHPCQALACFMTFTEHRGDIRGKRLVFVGDGNNVAHSLMLLAPLAGMDFAISCPEGYEPDRDVLATARDWSLKHGTTCSLIYDPHEAVKDADLIYTDVWASMGQEKEAATRAAIFMPYQVNDNLMKSADPDCLVTHCLPAHRGEEITSEVLDSKACIAIDEAENRLHAQKAVLYELMGAENR